ncbi:MAG: peptidase M12 [Kofleriaceae bacterium]
MKLCVPRYLPREDQKRSIAKAFEIWPNNRPDDYDESKVLGKGDKLALDIFRYWGDRGVELTVGFLETPDPELRRRILAHMNAWRDTANVSFVASDVDPLVRIARFTEAEVGPDHDGYWSNLGTDILLIDRDKPTMNLEAFTMTTSEDEFRRVVRHEAGHTLGFPHEHMRSELVARLDRARVIQAYMASQGWTEQDVIDQILTPLEAARILGTPLADETSIMCYQIAAELMLDGVAIPGGLDINETDRVFAAQVYPRTEVWPVRPGR